MIGGIFRSLVALFTGVMLVCFNQEVVPLLIRVVGLAFFLPAFLSLVRVYFAKGAAVNASLSQALISMLDVLRLVFGAWLIFYPVAFVNVFVVLAAGVLMLFSLYQIVVSVSKSKYLPWRFGLVVTPAVMLLASIVVMLNPFKTMTVASVVVGVCAIISGVSDIVISVLVKKYGKEASGNGEVTEV